MAIVTYTFVSRCAGGDHAVIDVSFNGGADKRMNFSIDNLRAPLASLTEEERTAAAEMLLRIHLAGKTRAQIVSEFQSPVTVTI